MSATIVKNRAYSLLGKYGLRHGFSDVLGKAGRGELDAWSLRLLIDHNWTATLNRSNALRH